MKNVGASPEDYFFSRSPKKTLPKFGKKKKVIPTTAGDKNTKGNAYRHTKSGFREDLNLNMRSNWEANIARIFRAYSIEFEFEPKVFSFPIKRGTKGYIPDFYLTETEEWFEVKGYLDDKSKIKIKRFKKYYPEEFNKLTFVISKYSSDAIKFAEELGIPHVIFYEDIRSAYMDKLSIWEGK
jgi:hypothetical protein